MKQPTPSHGSLRSTQRPSFPGAKMQVGPALAQVATVVLPLDVGVGLHPHKRRANHDMREIPIAHDYHVCSEERTRASSRTFLAGRRRASRRRRGGQSLVQPTLAQCE
jgi:hypothetical protein